MDAPPEGSSPVDDLLAQLGSRSRSDVVAYGLVGLLLLAALAGPPAWLALDERLARSLDLGRAAFRGDVYKVAGGLVYHEGPDGVPQDGAGDDVVLYEATGWRVRAVTSGGDALLALAIAVAVAWEAARALGEVARAPRGGLALEAGRAALLATPVVAVALAALFMLDRALPSAVAALEREGPLPLFAPVRPAVAGTVVVIGWALAFGWRLRSRADDAVGSPPA